MTALSKTAFAISLKETRYYLNGIFVHVDNGQLTFVATDGHRLSRYQIAAPTMRANMPDFILPVTVTPVTVPLR